MNHLKDLQLSCCALLLFILPLASQAQNHWQSSEQQATLLELFTSEGCSSCPVADRWLSRWTKRDELWNEIIPIAYHVDYWDDLGWPDKFASPSHSQRQYNYRKQNHSNSVYTPAFMVSGQEWRGFFSRKPFPFAPNNKVGVLRGSLESNQLLVTFNNIIPFKKPLTLHIALIGMNIESKIMAGENKGKVLNHDFVALKTYQSVSDKDSKHYQWQQEIPTQAIKNETVDAIAFWITEQNKMTPIQAAGGIIETESLQPSSHDNHL